MNLLSRGIRGYAIIVGGIAVLAVVWWANLYLFKQTTTETGWPLLVGAAILIVTLIVGLRWLRASGDSAIFVRPASLYQWGSGPSQSDKGDDAGGSSGRKPDYSGDHYNQR